jgi:hypothetical protein
MKMPQIHQHHQEGQGAEVDRGIDIVMRKINGNKMDEK